MPTPDYVPYAYNPEWPDESELVHGIWYYLGLSGETVLRYTENIKRLYIDVQINPLDLRDDCEFI